MVVRGSVGWGQCPGRRTSDEVLYAAGIEGLDRGAHAEPLGRGHECVFAMLALE